MYPGYEVESYTESFEIGHFVVKQRVGHIS